MMKKPFVISIIAIVIILICVVYSFAEERIILTTYYPAPYGVYKEMRADQMTVGSTYRNVPVNNGELLVSGKVGIGTTEPDTPLAFAGDVGQKIHLYGTQANGYVLGVESNDLRIAGGIGPSDYITFRTQGYNGTERMRIAEDGNIGIGTTDPYQLFHVKGGNIALDTGAQIVAYYSTQATPRPILGTDQNTAGIDYAYVRAADSGTNDGVAIQQSNGSTIAFFKQGGNVGIGTTNPASKLDVAGSLRTSGNVGIGGAPAVSSMLEVYGDITVNSGSIWTEQGLETSSNLIVDGDGAIDGKLGVGTYNPSPQFHVDATTTPWDDVKGLAQFQDNNDRVIAIGGMGMFRRDYNADNADLRINYIGYLGSTTRFRDFGVYDGKGSLILNVDGSDRKVNVASDANFAKDGNPIMQCSWEGRMGYADDGSSNDFGIVCQNGVIERWCHGDYPRGLASGVYTCS